MRIGVARCDPRGQLAVPVETVPRGAGDLARLHELVRASDAVEVVVGLPRSLSGREGPAAHSVREFAGRLADAVAPVPVRLVDERLTTVAATAALRASGRSAKRSRAVVDQAAAVALLQGVLDARA